MTVAFGGLLALGGIDLDVARGERLAVLGPERGRQDHAVQRDRRRHQADERARCAIKGVDCTSLPSRRRPSLGVARTYQKTRLFPGLTVEDNLLPRPRRQRGQASVAAAHVRSTSGRASGPRPRPTTVWLGDQLGTVVGDLSHGQQRQLEVGMAMVTDPDLMMLDEPASGLCRAASGSG